MNKYQEIAANYYTTKVDRDLRFHKFTVENNNTLTLQFLNMSENILYPVHTYSTVDGETRRYHQVLCQKPLNANHECILCDVQYSNAYKQNEEYQKDLQLKRSDKYYGLAVAYQKIKKGSAPEFQYTDYTISKEQWEELQKKYPTLTLTANEENGHMIIRHLPNVAIYSTSRKQSNQLMNAAIIADISTPEEMSAYTVKIMRTGTGLNTEYTYAWGSNPISLEDPLIQVAVDCILPLEELFDKWGSDEAYTSFSDTVSLCTQSHGITEDRHMGAGDGKQTLPEVTTNPNSDPWGQEIDPELLAAVDRETGELDF